MASSSDYEGYEGMTEDLLDDDDLGSRERPPTRLVSEFVRRAIDNTLGQVHYSSSVPKDALQYLLHQGDRGRREIVRIVAKEVGDFLRATDLSSELIKVLTSVQVDVSASVRFKRNANGDIEPDVQHRTEVAHEGQKTVVSDSEETGPHVDRIKDH